MQSILKNKKLLTLGLIIGVVIFLIIPKPAHAACSLGFSFSAADCVSNVFEIIGTIFNFLGGILFMFANFFLSQMLNLNLTILNNSTNSLIPTGWGIVRDVANLGFVLVIIVIAIATIVRFESYNAKKLLPKLIAAAILVNFSLTIAGVFINFSNILTQYFLSKAMPNGSTSVAAIVDPSTGITGQIVNAFSPQRFLLGDKDPVATNPDEDAGALTRFGTAVFASIAGLVFTIIFTLISAFTILIFGFLLLIRYIYLSFLLIIVPIVWLFWVIPDLSGQFRRWWSKFFEYVFFAPAAAFFLYLTLVAIQQLGKQPIPMPANIFASIQTIAVQGIQMLILCGLMLGGLIISQKLGMESAAGAIKFAGGIGKGVTKGLTGGKPFTKKAQEAAEKTGGGIAKGVARIPGLRRLAGIASFNVKEESKKLEQARIVKGNKGIGFGKLRIPGTKRKGSEDIVQDIRNDKLSIEDAKKKAGSRWRSIIPYANRSKARHIMALASLESGTEFEKDIAGEETGKIKSYGTLKGREVTKTRTRMEGTGFNAKTITETYKEQEVSPLTEKDKYLAKRIKAMREQHKEITGEKEKEQKAGDVKTVIEAAMKKLSIELIEGAKAGLEEGMRGISQSNFRSLAKELNLQHAQLTSMLNKQNIKVVGDGEPEEKEEEKPKPATT